MKVPVRLSNKEVIFTPQELAMLPEDVRQQVYALAPNAKNNKFSLKTGGFVPKGYKAGGVVDPDPTEIDQDYIDTKFDYVKQLTEEALAKKYPGKKISVVINGNTRTIKQAQANAKSGVGAAASIHSIGGARDFNILIDGKLADKKIHKDFLWPAAKEAGLFNLRSKAEGGTGRTGDDDPYHIGLVQELGDGTAFKKIFDKYPILKNNPNSQQALKDAQAYLKVNPKDTVYQKFVNSFSDTPVQAAATNSSKVNINSNINNVLNYDKKVIAAQNVVDPETGALVHIPEHIKGNDVTPTNKIPAPTIQSTVTSKPTIQSLTTQIAQHLGIAEPKTKVAQQALVKLAQEKGIVTNSGVTINPSDGTKIQSTNAIDTGKIPIATPDPVIAQPTSPTQVRIDALLRNTGANVLIGNQVVKSSTIPDDQTAQEIKARIENGTATEADKKLYGIGDENGMVPYQTPGMMYNAELDAAQQNQLAGAPLTKSQQKALTNSKKVSPETILAPEGLLAKLRRDKNGQVSYDRTQPEIPVSGTSDADTRETIAPDKFQIDTSGQGQPLVKKPKSKFGEYLSDPQRLLATAQTGIGIASLLSDGKRPEDTIDPKYLDAVAEANADKTGLGVATRTLAENDIELQRRTAADTGWEATAGMPSMGLAHIRAATRDASLATSQLSKIDEELKLKKREANIALLADIDKRKRTIFEDKISAFNKNQETGGSMVKSGIENFIDSRREKDMGSFMDAYMKKNYGQGLNA